MRKTGTYPSDSNDGEKVFSGKQNNCVDKNLSNGTDYFYTVFAVYQNGRLGQITEDSHVHVTPRNVSIYSHPDPFVDEVVSFNPLDPKSVFGSWGITRARYKDGSVASGRSIQGNTVPYAPTYTSNVGLQYSRPVRALTLYARGEVTMLGDFEYDETNDQGQDGYSLTGLRAGGRVGTCFVEGWIQNAFDTKYVPLAFPYPGLAPSGYIGEPGVPRTFGIRAGVRF